MDTAVAPTVTPTTPTPAATTPQVPPQVVTTPPTAAGGTTTPASSGSFQDSLKKAVSNPLQIGFGILGAAALYYLIYYYQYKIQFNKVFVKTIENKIDELDMKYSDIVSKLNKQETKQEQLFF